jgi:hypothetical protein
MNTLFYTTNGKVTEQEPVAYWNIIRQQADDAFDALGGIDFDRDSASEYLDDAWRSNLTGDNLDTGEKSEPIMVSDELWNEYKNAILDEVEKLVETAKENISYKIAEETIERAAENPNQFVAPKTDDPNAITVIFDGKTFSVNDNGEGIDDLDEESAIKVLVENIMQN